LQIMTPRIVPPKLLLPALATLLNAVIAIPAPALGQSPPNLKLRLKVTSSAASVAKGLNLPLHAAHVFANGSTADVTRRAIWMSSNPQIAIVSNLATQQGTVTGVNPGVVTITAISGPERGSLNITVTGPAIVAVTVTPPNDSVAVSATQPYTAIASFSDQSTPQDITNTATWSSTPNANMSGHTASGVTPGIATITALDPASKVTGRTSLNVGLGSIVSIRPILQFRWVRRSNSPPWAISITDAGADRRPMDLLVAASRHNLAFRSGAKPDHGHSNDHRDFRAG
jgi:hypothetical protein